MRTVFFALILALIGFDPVQAQDAADRDKCFGNKETTADDRIRSCTALVNVKTLSPADLSEALFQRGLAYYRQKKNDLAVADYTRVIAIRPSAASYLNRGVAFFDRVPEHTAKLKEAIEDFTKALALQPGYLPALQNRAEAYGRQGSSQQAIADWSAVLAVQKDNVNAYFSRGMEYSRGDDHRRAMDDFDEVLKRDPKHALARIYLGRAFFQSKDFDRAIRTYDRLLESNAGDIPVLSERASILIETGKLDEAIRDYRAIEDKDPYLSARIAKRSAVAFLEKGRSLSGQKAYRDALPYLNEAIYHDPDNALSYYLRGIVHQELRALERAKVDYSQAIRLDPKNPWHWNGRCWARAADAHGYRPNLEEALPDCNQALKLQPDFVYALDSRGFVLFRLGKLKEALADYDAALKGKTRLPLSYYARSFVKRALGDEKGAQQDMDTALALDVTVVGQWDAISK